jgi:hypothetical protein
MNECYACGHMNRDDRDFCLNCKTEMFRGNEDLRKKPRRRKK